MSLKKAHLVDWAVRTEAGRQTLLRIVAGDRQLTDIPVRFDPSLNRALDYAVGEALIVIEKKTTGSILTLMPQGEQIATTVYAAESFLAEKAFFNGLRGKLTEEKAMELLEWENRL